MAEPKGNGPFDSRAEEAIDWYQHYMAVQIEDLALEYISKKGSEGPDPSPMMEKAIEARSEEAGRVLLGEEVDR